MLRMNQPHRIRERRKAAELRQEERAKLTPQQQLAKLDKMFGDGQGAARERVRLQKQIKFNDG